MWSAFPALALRQTVFNISQVILTFTLQLLSGCVSQLFSGGSGMVQSYNWEAQTTQLRGMAYLNCFRQELGYCAIDFFTPDAGSAPDYYHVSTAPANANGLVSDGFNGL